MDLYETLKTLSEQPDVFSVYTAETLWTEPHLSKMMLEMHLSQDTALASRPFEAVDRVVDWIDQTFGLDGQSVCDLGCGPGLYANRYASRGANVTGLDFSKNSIDYALRHTPTGPGSVTYRLANYLTDPLPQEQDIITLIYCDLCPLSPSQRQTLMRKVREALRPDGRFIFDVYSSVAFETVKEGTLFERNLMNGFWSSRDYFGLQHTFKYEDEAVSLDRFDLFEENRSWTVYNWLQYFSQDDIRRELEQAGFKTIECVPGFGTDSSDSTTFGVVASLQSC